MTEVQDQEDLMMGTEVEILGVVATVVITKEMACSTVIVVYMVEAVINMVDMVVVAMEITTVMVEQVTETCKKVSVYQFCTGCNVLKILCSVL